MFDPASRFNLVQEANVAPGVCLVTKTDKGPFVDTGMELNKFDSIWAEVNMARIYLSVDVIREMAEGAGLFDEIREKAIAETVEAYSRGRHEGVTEGGELAAAADRLVDALAGIGHGTRASEPIIAQGEVGPDPLVLVTDGNELRGVRKVVARPDREHRAPSGQGDGTGEKRGRALVPGNSSDGVNPFSI